MSKKTKSFTVDDNVAEELSRRDDLNASAIVNNFLSDYLEHTDKTTEEAVLDELDRQIAEVNDDLEELEERKETLVDRRERIADNIAERENEQLKEAARKVATTETNTFGTTIADGDQLKQVARNHDVDPAELREEVLNEDG